VVESLTKTEGRIAELVARGLRNDEVAERLGLSPKTVEWNLTKVYRKLGLRSRTELVATLAQLSPFESRRRSAEDHRDERSLAP
jgi:DNA-binding CsgD family transcriptional regulator